MSQADLEGCTGDGYPLESPLKNHDQREDQEVPSPENAQILDHSDEAEQGNLMAVCEPKQQDVPNPPDQREDHEAPSPENAQIPDHLNEAEQGQGDGVEDDAVPSERAVSHDEADNQCADTLPKAICDMGIDDDPHVADERREWNDRNLPENPHAANEGGLPNAPNPPDNPHAADERREQNNPNLPENNPPVGHPDGDENYNPDEEALDNDENRENINVRVEAGGAQQVVEARPTPGENEPDPNLHDKCQKIIKSFANPNEFYKFAWSSDGLKMDDVAIRLIQNKNDPILDKMQEVMDLWLSRNREASCHTLDAIVEAYHTRKKNTNGAKALANQNQNVNQGVAKERMEDVFLEVFNSFLSHTYFKIFARAGNGLRLNVTEVNRIIDSNRRDTQQQQVEMLRLWQQNNKDATAEMLRELTDRYLTSKK